MIAWISKRRFNYIDGLGIAMSSSALIEGQWLSAFAISVVMSAVSIVAEAKGGE